MGGLGHGNSHNYHHTSLHSTPGPKFSILVAISEDKSPNYHDVLPPQAHSLLIPPRILPSANTCTAPSSGHYICTGNATSGDKGTCTSVACTPGYHGDIVGHPMAPACSNDGGIWSFTGSCVGEKWERVCMLNDEHDVLNSSHGTAG